jgi:hypothetical protein
VQTIIAFIMSEQLSPPFILAIWALESRFMLPSLS